MKKQLEADLISIAHRVLQLKNKSDINQLYLETQKLYEKLAVLRFVDQHFSETRPTIGRIEIEKEIESIFDKSESIPEQETVEIVAKEKIETASVKELTSIDERIEPVSEEIISNEISIEETDELESEAKVVLENAKTSPQNTKNVVKEEDTKTVKDLDNANTTPLIPAFKTSEIGEDEKEPEVAKKTEAVQISFEDLLGGNYHDTLFVKKQQVENIPTAVVIETPKVEEKIKKQNEDFAVTDIVEDSDAKKVSLNDKLSKGLNIDLNDRLAFIKHLFGNNSEDYNRVVNQLITFNTFYETRDFVQEMVKPDYNNWEGKQEYEDRFMNIIEKKFL
ncbi:hypothetical protein SAMN05444372_101275 [Flavobacterium micromati]|uniref:Uncharacterized protein n=1 Tax=Flavobacterium micromati TaxID=229205 RepID=A0A1M5FSM7_9FLAO|nr:hypothetical protein [Flavobacterium micromati]SHF94525.1 hypothetical protein SAMN05444372_101275 [Flavobacterium micromati]